MHRPRPCFAFIAGSSRFATLRATKHRLREAAELADDSEHGKLSRGIKRSVDVTTERAGKLAHDAEWIFGRRVVRVVGALAILAIVVAFLFLLLNWYVDPTKPSERKDLVLALAQILAGTALLSGLYFTWRTLQVNREGQITDRFTRAIDQLGKVDDNNKKLMEIRLGGIYALERIARESEEDHWPIMEVLTAYVRQHAPLRQEENQHGEEDLAVEKSAEEDSGDARQEAEPTEAPAPDPDIQAIMTVLRRRTCSFGHGEPEPLDLHYTDLSKANLSGADLSGARLSEAILTGADLSGADLSYAVFFLANLRGVDLSGADLSAANFSWADVSESNFSGANLIDMTLSGADLSGAQHLTQEQLEQAHGDEKTQLPPRLKPPADWGVKTDEQTEGG